MFKKIFEYIFGKGFRNKLLDDVNPLLFHWRGRNCGDIECTDFIHNLRREGNFLYFEKVIGIGNVMIMVVIVWLVFLLTGVVGLVGYLMRVGRSIIEI